MGSIMMVGEQGMPNGQRSLWQHKGPMITELKTADSDAEPSQVSHGDVTATTNPLLRQPSARSPSPSTSGETACIGQRVRSL